MIKCWLCRESLEHGALTDYGIKCPSCLSDVREDGTMRTEPGAINVGIALARAMNRLTRAMAIKNREST